MGEPNIREITDLDPVAFCDLFLACFGKSVDGEYFKWKFQSSPDGPALHVVAEVEGRIVGLVNFMPSRFRVHGTDLKTCQAADVMVHPDFQRRGLLASMTRLANEKMADRGWRFIVNVTGDVLFSTYLKLGHHHVCDLQHYSAAAPGAVVWKVVRKLAGGNPHQQPPATFDERFEQLWQRSADCRAVAQVRDRAYLTWRYEQRPDRRYSLLTDEGEGDLRGFAILRGPYLVDLWTDGTSPVVNRLLTASRRALRQAGETTAGLVVDPLSFDPAALRRHGFKIAPASVAKLGQAVTFRCADAGLEQQLLGSPWYVTMGDSDWF